MSSLKERNREIWERFHNGETAPSLAREYSISLTRVHQLIASENAHEHRSKLPTGALSVRSVNGLLNNGIVSVRLEEITPNWVVANLDEGDLRAIRSLGKNGRNEITAWLAIHGLTLRKRNVVWNPLTHQPIPRGGSSS
ncbi:Mor transcription activator family protein [Methylosinus sp. LW3]|uniref:Mor transcription activator family protein n=1 Tax=Methylosinus sp. LW3 TaxID=107635 RepID=UPI0012F8F196|nr:Mor transcription activator family protein [Methylosinus sp. LW3]